MPEVFNSGYTIELPGKFLIILMAVLHLRLIKSVSLRMESGHREILEAFQVMLSAAVVENLCIC